MSDVPARWTVALASPRPAVSLVHGLEKIEASIREAQTAGAAIVCFPEAYLPGLRGQDFPVFEWDGDTQGRVVEVVGGMARRHHVAVILGLEWLDEPGRQIGAAVFGRDGSLLGVQTKNQLDPSEDHGYVPGHDRHLFRVDGVPFGVTICHEGWRYPETVRWAAARGAPIVFHPQHTGNETDGVVLTTFGSPEAPYYESAMRMRSIENTIWFASVNYALRFQESATAFIDPNGDCHAWQPYGQEGVLVRTLDLAAATGLLARRWAPERYGEARA